MLNLFDSNKKKWKKKKGNLLQDNILMNGNSTNDKLIYQFICKKNNFLNKNDTFILFIRER